MDFATAIKTGFSKYNGFAGRSARSEYWNWCLFVLICGLALAAFDSTILESSDTQPTNLIFNIITFLPSLAVSIRRLHDIDKSGWWLLLWFIPLIGWFVLVLWACKRGTKGKNNFGPDPLKVTKAKTKAKT